MEHSLHFLNVACQCEVTVTFEMWFDNTKDQATERNVLNIKWKFIEKKSSNLNKVVDGTKRHWSRDSGNCILKNIHSYRGR